MIYQHWKTHQPRLPQRWEFPWREGNWPERLPSSWTSQMNGRGKLLGRLRYASFIYLMITFQICEHQCRYRPICDLLLHLFLLLIGSHLVEELWWRFFMYRATWFNFTFDVGKSELTIRLPQICSNLLLWLNKYKSFSLNLKGDWFPHLWSEEKLASEIFMQPLDCLSRFESARAQDGLSLRVDQRTCWADPPSCSAWRRESS